MEPVSPRGQKLATRPRQRPFNQDLRPRNRTSDRARLKWLVVDLSSGGAILEINNAQAAIEYPQEGESISSPHYTFRIRAAISAEKVEICVDGSPWQLCRYSAGYWWHDWSGYSSGEHEIVVRVLPFDSRNYVLKTRRVHVQLGVSLRPVALRKMTQYSLLTSGEPLILAQLAQILADESIDLAGLMTVAVGDSSSIQVMAERSSDLRERLEAAGIPVVERDVFELRLPNRPDQLERLTRALAERGIAIRSLYGTADGETVKLVLAVDQFEAAEPVVGRLESAEARGN